MNTNPTTVLSVRVRAVVAPMPKPLHTGSGALTAAPLVLVDLQTSAGTTGHAYLFAFTPDNVRPIVSLVDTMGRIVAGEPLAPFDLEARLRKHYALLGVHNVVSIAMAGIDMAAWDAFAQELGQPLVRVLGGTPRPVPAYNSKGLGIMPIDDLAQEAESLVRERFAAVKLRLGRRSAKEDLEAVRVVKKAIGPEVALMCDFNQALTVAEAIARGRMLDAEGGLVWIEEPTRADDFQGNARISEAVATPIQIGENFMGPEQMAQALSAHACDYVMPDAQRIGGVTGWMRAAALAQGPGCEMSSHLFPEISAHLLAVTPTRHWLEYVDWANAILAEPLAVTNGVVVASAAPGTGIRWSEAAVAQYAL